MQSLGKYQEVINKITHNNLTEVEVLGEILMLVDTLIQDLVDIDNKLSKSMRYGPILTPASKPKLKLVTKEEYIPEVETVPDVVKDKAIKALRSKELEKTGPKTGFKYTEKQKKQMKMRRVAKSKTD